ncbi:MAG TPA: hypothetical protein VGJ70_21910 [Solirubrobacteraceae bacterium]
MNPLRTIARDLFERRLWPVAAGLVALLVAIPVVFLRPSPAALETAATAPAPAAAAPAVTTAAPATDAADVATDPSVGLTSSPFAAAFGAGLSLPPSMQGLLKSTKGPDATKEVADGPLHDPFAVAAKAAALAPAAPAPAASAAKSTPAATPAPAADSTPAPAPVEHVSTPSPAPAQPADNGSAADGTVFHADVRFGTTETPPMVRDAKRLTAFPTSLQPVAVYLGVMRGGWGAVFALRTGTQPIGAPSCRPRRQICTWVILHPGEAVTLNSTDEQTGTVTPYQLKLERIRRTVVSAGAAKLANGKVSTSGRCLLGPLAAYRYDAATGTLAARPELKACRYSTPGQAKAASIRVAHIG